jgi:hypothetical protein
MFPLMGVGRAGGKGMGSKSAGGGRGEPFLEPWRDGGGNMPPDLDLTGVWGMGAMNSAISDPKRSGGVE